MWRIALCINFLEAEFSESDVKFSLCVGVGKIYLYINGYDAICIVITDVQKVFAALLSFLT